MKKNKREIFICVDFDGVLAEYSGFKGKDHYGEPLKGAREFLEKLNSIGLPFWIFTTRPPKKVEVWLIKYDMPKPKKVTNKKPPSPVYIDDGAIKFNGDFNKLLEELKNFKPYWKESFTLKDYFK